MSINKGALAGMAVGSHSKPYLFATGLTMGAADIVPGVSGGTMAFIMGVYEKLIDSIKAVDLEFAKLLLSGRIKAAFAHLPLDFLLPLSAGILLSLVSLAQIIDWLLASYPTFLFALFFGLVLASVFAVAMHLKRSVTNGVVLLAAATLAWWLVGLIPGQSPHTPLIIFCCGAVAITAMILPGLSGSFILLILGQYAFMLNALKTFDLTAVMPFVAGAALGLAFFSRVLSWLLTAHYQLTIAGLVGFMLGSLRRIWPFKETVQIEQGKSFVEQNVLPDLDLRLGICLLLALAGFGLIVWLNSLQNKST